MQETISILVVGDKPQNLIVIEGLLNNNYELSYASTESNTINSWGEFVKPDLILVDIKISALNTIEICRQIRAIDKWQCVPIVMITDSNIKEEDLAHYLKAGVDDFICQPLNSVTFTARVNSMAKIKKQCDQIQSQLKQPKLKQQNNAIAILEKSFEQLGGDIASNLSKSNELNVPLNNILSCFLMLEVLLEEDHSNLDMQLMSEIISKGKESTDQLENTIEKLLMRFQLKPENFQNSNKVFDWNNYQKRVEKIVKSKVTSLNRLDDFIFYIDSDNFKIHSSGREHLN